MLTDAELVDGVVAGYDSAFAELYQRHSSAAWRLGQTVTGNAEDAADAVAEAFARVLVAVRAGHLDKGSSFRSYLLTATRNAALDNIRKTSRARPTDQEYLVEVECTSPTPSERLGSHEEAALVSEAFRNLPERWRSVLWLTEVEGMATKEAARRLGLTANGAAQLAVRARAGLRERFLQAHLRQDAPAPCETTVERLGAYVGGGLSPRDLAKVDQHLAGCPACQARKDELEDLGASLRRAAVPVPLALAATVGGGGLGAGLATSASPAALGKLAKAVAWGQQAWAQKAVAAAAAGVLALGAGGAYMAGSEANERSTTPMVAAAAEPADTSGEGAPTTTGEAPDTGTPPAEPASTAAADDSAEAPIDGTESAEPPCGATSASGAVDADRAGAAADVAADPAQGAAPAEGTGASAQGAAGSSTSEGGGELRTTTDQSGGGLAAATRPWSGVRSGELPERRRWWEAVPTVGTEVAGPLTGVDATVDLPGDSGSGADAALEGVTSCVEHGDLGDLEVDLDDLGLPGVSSPAG